MVDVSLFDQRITLKKQFSGWANEITDIISHIQVNDFPTIKTVLRSELISLGIEFSRLIDHH